MTEDVVVRSVTGTNDVGHCAWHELLVGNGADGLVQGWVERPTGVIAPGEPKIGKHRDRLLMHCAYPLDDVLRIGRRMFEGALQVVEYRQPAGGGSRPLLLSGPYQVLGASFAEVVQLRSGTPPAILQIGNPRSG